MCDRLGQIHEIWRVRHFWFGAISCFGWHSWHKICWFCGFVVIQCDSLQIAFWTAPGPRQPQRSFPLLTNLNFCYFPRFMRSPEELAREKIDELLVECGWTIQNRSTINLSAARGVALREALLKERDEVDYLLFVDGKAIGTVEAKPEGYTLTGVEEQSGKYGKGLLDIYPKWREPLPFAY